MTEFAGDCLELERTRETMNIDIAYDRPRTSIHPVNVKITASQVRGRLLCAWRWLLRARPRESMQLVASIEHSLSDLDEASVEGYGSQIALLRAIACALEHSPAALMESLAGLGLAQHDADADTLPDHSTAEVSTHAHVHRPTEHSGEHLSPRECAVLLLISQGKSNKRVARALTITPETVKSHMKRVFIKLGSRTRAEAVARATALGLLIGAPNAALSPQGIDSHS